MNSKKLEEIIDYNSVENAIESLLVHNEKPTILNIKKQFQLDNEDCNQIIEYYLYMWEQRHTTTYLDTIDPTKLSHAENKKEFLKRTLQLEESLAMMRATIEATADCLLMISATGKLIGYNQKFVDLYRIPKKILASKDETKGLQYVFGQVVDPEELADLVSYKYRNPIAGNCGEMAFKDGRWVERYYQPQIVNKKVVGHVWSFRDISERKQHEKSLLLKQRAIDASTHAILIARIDGNKMIVEDINPVFTKITGYEREKLLNKNFLTFIKNNTKKLKTKLIKEIVHLEETSVFEISFEKSTGDVIWCELHLSPVKNDNQLVDYYVCILVEITARKLLESELLHKAHYDAMTQLPNRALIIDRINQLIKISKRKNKCFGIYFIDLDYFKLTNDTLGHTFGDELLKSVAKRLSNSLRAVDSVGRFGGDEFIVVSNTIKDIDHAYTIADKLISLFFEPFNVNNNNMSITASIGVSIFPDDGDNYESLIKKSDIAMYQAKNSGRNNFKFFQKKMDAYFEKRLSIVNQLRNSLQKEEMYLLYQPIVETISKKIVGVEALVRFPFSEEINVSVFDIIRVAEDIGLITNLGNWVLERACYDIKKINSLLTEKLALSVNASNIQIQDSTFSETVKAILTKTGFPKELFQIEMTESVLVAHRQSSLSSLRELINYGISFALDDFGTGYSSLDYLHKFPIRTLKIDKSFTDKVKEGSNDPLLIDMIVSIGKFFKMKVLAEGVETEFQYNYLKAAGTTLIQGYYFSKPINTNELLKLATKLQHKG